MTVRYRNKDVGFWLNPSGQLIHVSVLPLSANKTPDFNEREREKISVLYHNDGNLRFVTYEQANSMTINLLGADLKPKD